MAKFSFKYSEVVDGRKKFLLDIHNKQVFEDDDFDDDCKKQYFKIIWSVINEKRNC